MALWKIIPPEEGNDLCHRLVNHGREVCTDGQSLTVTAAVSVISAKKMGYECM